MSYANRVVIVIAAVLAVFFAPVSTSRAANPYGFVPPTGTHPTELGPAGFTAMHEGGYLDPFDADAGADGFAGCNTCHGTDLRGGPGLAPSCYTCHGDYWTYDVTDYPPAGTGWLQMTDPDHIAYQANPYQIWPDSHTLGVSDMMEQSYAPAKAYWACWYCHEGTWGTGPDFKTTVYHGPGYATPVESGCTQCHGANLDGVGGFAVGCTWCHQKQWVGVGGGLPLDHFNMDFEGPWALGSELKGGPSEAEGGVWHRYGWENPTSVYPQNGYGGDGCTRCHGSDLAGPAGPDISGNTGNGDGFAPSCYSCHGVNGIGPPTDHTVPKGSTPNYHKPGYDDPYLNGCTQCHGADLSGTAVAPSCFTCHGPNHDQPLGTLGVRHKAGYEDPFGAGGCTACHGPHLNDGSASSCFTCHGARWDPHDFSAELWLPPGENTCYVCHLPPDFNQTGPVWNHVPATSTYVVTDAESLVTATVGQPNGTSAKCMDCHEGAPSGPAVEDYGSATGGVYFVEGEEAFGTDLTQHHPVSFNYLDADQTGLNDPAVTPSGRTRHGTIASDILEGGQVQCTSCHDQHDNSKGNYLFETVTEDSCFICHKRHSTTPLRHHIPGRLDPWGATRGTTFNCTLCHGVFLQGNGQDVPACISCHNQFASPDAPAPGHHGGNRYKPYFDCATCHADPLTGVVTGNRFGGSYAPSCYKCHDDLWNVAGNFAPTVDAGGPYVGTVGQAITFDATNSTDPESDPLAFAWSFGDGSQSPMPSHDPKMEHTFSEAGVYHAALSVTDGVNPPQLVLFDVTVDAVAQEVEDTWHVTTTHAPAKDFSITFEDRSGSLVGVKDDGGLAFGIEFVGVIYWMELWMDLSGDAFWGTGDIYFGNIDREAGSMTGVVLDPQGGAESFSGTQP